MALARFLLLFLFSALSTGSFAQQSDSCPADFDRSKAKDGELFLRSDVDNPLNTANVLAPSAPETVSIPRADARFYFYFMNRNAPWSSGAIAIKRIYRTVNSFISDDVVLLSNNQALKDKEEERGLSEYIAYHQRPLGNDNRFRQDFHFKYFGSRNRSDDRQDKVNSVQFDTALLGPSKINKVLLLRYKGLRSDGSCIPFSLFSKEANGLLSQTRNFLLEIQELDSASNVSVPRVFLKVTLN